MWEVTVKGRPVPKPDPKCFGRGGQHRLTIPEKAPGYKDWRTRCNAAGQALVRATGQKALLGAWSIELIFIMQFPASLTPARRPWPAVRNGDIDKLTRLMLDALTDAQVWGDDSLVVDLHAVKVYPHSPHPDADVLGGDTGAVIRIWRPTQHA